MIEITGITNYAAFLGAAVLLNVTPGSDTMYILAHTAAQGKRAGLLSALGISTGGLIHTVAAVCGVSALIATEPGLFQALKVGGALFLLYLGFRAFREKGGEKRKELGARRSQGRIYLSAVLTNVLNPKVAIFFLAFLPQFIEADAENIPFVFLLLGLTFLTTGTLWSLVLVACASELSAKIGANRHVLVRTSGVIFILLGVHLLFFTA